MGKSVASFESWGSVTIKVLGRVVGMVNFLVGLMLDSCLTAFR